MTVHVIASAAVVCLAVLLPTTSVAARDLPRLKVSDNGRFLVTEQGKPFFWLGDTAWLLLQNLTEEEAEHYLRDRAAKRFTVIQAMAVPWNSRAVPNAAGELAFIDGDPTRPNEKYWTHVDAVVAMAARLGLYIGLLPTWGDAYSPREGGEELLTPENAGIYGEFLGRRYRDRPVIWILGGDRSPENDRHLDTIRALARGLRRGDEGRHLMTFHPGGWSTSSRWFHEDDWLAFNMIQSGHHDRNIPNYDLIAADYALHPPKPCLDGEADYEDHPVNWHPENGHFNDYDVRKTAYWAAFAGAHGHTYGCNEVWQFYVPGRQPYGDPRRPWQEAISLPGAAQMQHLRGLIASRPFLSRIPDQSLVLPAAPKAGRLTHLVYTRAPDGQAVLYVNAVPEATARVGGTMGNWDGSFRLALANELTEDRPWLGEYRLVAIYDKALTASQVQQRFQRGSRSMPAGAVVLYTFTAGAGDVVRDASRARGGITLRISHPSAVEWLKDGGLAVRAPVLIASNGPATALTDAITRSQAITIEAWVKPVDYAQAGPARIVTLSQDPVRRNLTLGQQGDGYEVRLRTTTTSDNGLPGVATGGPEARHVQATRDADGSYAMIYLPAAGQTVTVDTSKLSGKRLKAWWYDPRTGTAQAQKGELPVGGKLEFTSPKEGPDWVLVLDDAARRFGPPGETGRP
jgi:hypothetical protein